MILSVPNPNYQKKSAHKNNHNPTTKCTFCGEIVEIDILMIGTFTSKMPSSCSGFNHVLLAVDSFHSYIPIKSMTKPQLLISALVTKYCAGHPIKKIRNGLSV